MAGPDDGAILPHAYRVFVESIMGEDAPITYPGAAALRNALGDLPVIEEIKWRLDVTADKPGRAVTVDIDRVETGAWSPSLSIDPAGGIGGEDHWTWLTVDEAREV